jgi:ABC-2 type transport system permease protein
MAANASLHRVHERGWRRGFANTLRKESRDWWRARRWWVNALIWLVLLNGVLAAGLWLSPGDGSADVPAGQGALSQFAMMGVVTTVIGAIMIMQNTLIDEKKTGTAEWILSKPVSRSAFVLSKFLGNAVATLLIAVVLQGVLAWVQVSAKSGSAVAVTPLVLSLGIIGLQLLFFMALTLMLGTFFNGRGAVLVVPLALIFVVMFASNYAPGLMQILPFTMGLGTTPDAPMLAVAAIEGQPLPTVVPIISTAVWTLVFLGIAIWRFGREEF